MLRGQVYSPNSLAQLLLISLQSVPKGWRRTPSKAKQVWLKNKGVRTLHSRLT